MLLSHATFMWTQFSGWLPVIRTAISYPLTNRFRTGMTLAMFTLVVFTLVVGAVTTNASPKRGTMKAYGGGYDIRAETVRVNPVDDIRGQSTRQRTRRADSR